MTNVNSSGRKEVIYTFTSETAKVEVEYEGLERMKEDKGLVKVESDGPENEVEVKQEVEEPGMTRMDEVLEILDRVEDIGA